MPEQSQPKDPKSIIAMMKRDFLMANIRDISIALDTYDDIFSDFDPRPYSSRQLSHDFLKEIRARYRETHGGKVEVHFIVPDAIRDSKKEAVIRKRMRDYFVGEMKVLAGSVHKIRQDGIIYIIIGAVLLFMQTFLEITLKLTPTYSQLLQILFVPAGWFGMFEGIERLVETPREISHSMHVASRFQDASFIFMSESEAQKAVAAAEQ